MKKELKIKISRAHRQLAVMTNPENRKVLNVLQGGTKTMTEIWIETRLNWQSRVSRALGDLRASGLVKAYKKGKHVYYQVDRDQIARKNKAIINFLES